MQDAQSPLQALRILLHWAEGALEIAAGLFAFYIVLKALILILRLIDGGSRARAIAARARIEAEMRARAERAATPPPYDPRDPAHALRRRLAAIDEILRSSSFPGERAAAQAARARILAQLGQ